MAARKKKKAKKAAPRKRTPRKPKPTWTTATGETMLIEKMRDDHLLNSHRMLRRKTLLTPWVQAIVDLEAEIRKRDMQPLPVFLHKFDEAEHILGRIAKAGERVARMHVPDPDPSNGQW